MGSDIASSIRNPASYCGVYGHKPTFGISPPRGHAVTGRVSPDDIQVIGPLARSAGDLDLALSVMAGPDEIDASGYRLTLPPPRQKSLKDYRVAVMLSDPTSEVDREVQDALQRLADFLAKNKAKVSDSARPAIDMDRAHKLFNLLLRAATSHRQTDEQFAPTRAAAAALAADDDSHAARMLRAVTIGHREWLSLDEERHRMRLAWHEFFKDFDVLLCPTVPAAAYPHEHAAPAYQRTQVINGKVLPFFTTLFWAGLTGLAYLPSTAIPIGFSADGLPLGAQIVGPQYGDLTCIQLAKLLEKSYQGFVPPPGYDA
jgi:amidase